MDQQAPAGAPSNAILTAPNLITFARLAMIPVFVWLGLDGQRELPAAIVGGIAGISDIVDGYVARRFRQVSKLGVAMDPLVDRLLIAAGAIILVARDYAPLWAVLVVVIRDALVLLAVPFLARKGVARPAVSTIGKRATLAIIWAFGLMIVAHIPDPPATWVRVVAWAWYVPGVVLSYAAAFGYAATARRELREAAR